jgi:hypothetical protein
MKKAILIFALYACNATAPVAEQKTVIMPAVCPISLGAYMDSMAVRHNIPIEVIEGISWNESHFGASTLAKRTNNLFGIKCGDGWKGQRSGTWRKYGCANESVADFCEYIKKYYSHLIGKPLNRWVIKGYAEKPYKFTHRSKS